MSHGFKSLILVCANCNEEFVFTAKAQAYFDHIGRRRKPERCKFCYIASKKLERALGGADSHTSGLA